MTHFVSALVGLWLWPFDLETDAQCSTCHGVPSCQFWWHYDYSFSIFRPLGQHGPDWSRDFVTMIFDLGGHGACDWCGSSSSIGIPSLKFVGLAIQKIWRRICLTHARAHQCTGIRVNMVIYNLNGEWYNETKLFSWNSLNTLDVILLYSDIRLTDRKGRQKRLGVRLVARGLNVYDVTW